MLVGHSMGGALAVHAGSSKQIAGLEGVVVVDVVEGTALGERRLLPPAVVMGQGTIHSALVNVCIAPAAALQPPIHAALGAHVRI